MKDFWHLVFYAYSQEITFTAMAMRAFIVFVLAIVAVRIGDRRFFGKNSIFDVILALIWGSLLSRSITGNAPFLPTLGVAILFVFMHWLMSFVAFRIKHIGWLYKGSPSLLIKDGKLQIEQMRKLNISEKDLIEWIHIRGKLKSIEEVQEAYYERNGDISIIPKRTIVKEVKVKIEEGVEEIRIKIEK